MINSLRKSARSDAQTAGARSSGRSAARKGEAYANNPFDRGSQPELHLAWSEGHNEQRAAMGLSERARTTPDGRP